jgi:hypothetical protein
MPRTYRALIVTISIAACGPATDRASDVRGVTVRDSAGIRIVENSVAGGVVPTYGEVGQSDLSIGVVDGEPAYAFGRIVGVRSLEGGEIVVLDAQARELRVFDSQGRYMRTLGRRGQGPGEFSNNLTGIAGVAGDTVWVWDSGNLRVTTFGLEGEVLESVGFERSGALGNRVSRLSDGAYLSVRRFIPPLGVTRSDLVVVRIERDGGGLDTLVVLPGQEAFSWRNCCGGTMVAPHPVGRASSVAAGPRHVALGSNEAYRIDLHDLTGVLHTSVRVTGLERALAPAEVERALNHQIERCRDVECEAAWPDAFAPELLPALRPAFSALMVDALGQLWVAEFEPEPVPVSGWHVFSPEGELLGRVATPLGLEVHEIGADYLLGVELDELEVSFVRRYPLARLR